MQSPCPVQVASHLEVAIARDDEVEPQVQRQVIFNIRDEQSGRYQVAQHEQGELAIRVHSESDRMTPASTR